MTTITYRTLADRLDNLFLFNKVNELDQDFVYEGLENGTLDYCAEHNNDSRQKCLDENHEFENFEIYQYYLIGSADADYLKRHTTELVFWSETLEEYIWGVTHFGTSWDGVELEFYEDEEEKAKAEA